MAAVAGGVQRGGGFARCARARWPCRRPCGSRAPTRSGRGRWRASRARSAPASAPGRGARSRATVRRARRRRGRAGATAWRAGPAAIASRRASGARPSVVLACATSPCCSKRLGQRSPDRQLVVAFERGLEQRSQQFGGRRGLAPLDDARRRGPSRAAAGVLTTAGVYQVSTRVHRQECAECR